MLRVRAYFLVGGQTVYGPPMDHMSFSSTLPLLTSVFLNQERCAGPTTPLDAVHGGVVASMLMDIDPSPIRLVNAAQP
jgi:hypothetical protein